MYSIINRDKEVSKSGAVMKIEIESNPTIERRISDFIRWSGNYDT